MKSLLILLVAVVSSTALADIRCSKRVPFSAQAYDWVVVEPIEGRTDAMQFLFGTGLSDRLSEVAFTDLVLPPVDGQFRNAPTSDFDIAFTRGKSGRFDLVVRDRASGKSSTIRNFRCD